MVADQPDAKRSNPLAFDSAETAAAWHRDNLTQGYLTPGTEFMLDLAGIRTGDRVLDVAAGTGIQTLMVARRVGPSGVVIATDIAPSMLDVAAEAVRQAGMTNVETRVMDAQQLDFEPDSFDVAVCRQGLMFIPDIAGVLTSIQRILKPGGRFAAMVVSTPEQNPHPAILYGTVRRVGRLPTLAEQPPAPFSVGAPGFLEAAYRKAGFRDVIVQVVAIQMREASAAESVASAKVRWAALREELAALSVTDQEEALAEMERELRRFEGPDGYVVPGENLVVIGTK